jgi:hypothetical protein
MYFVIYLIMHEFDEIIDEIIDEFDKIIYVVIINLCV